MDARFMAPRLRPEDRREIEHVSGRTPHEVLSLALSMSSEAHVFIGQNGPFCMFGVADDPGNAGYGVVWLLATNEVKKHIRFVIRQAPLFLSRWALRYPNGLHNYADSRNLLHLRWLIHTGFKLGEEKLIRGVPFVYFIRHKE